MAVRYCNSEGKCPISLPISILHIGNSHTNMHHTNSSPLVQDLRFLILCALLLSPTHFGFVLLETIC